MRVMVVAVAMAVVGCNAGGVTPASRCAWNYQAGATNYVGSVEQPSQPWTCSAPVDAQWAPGSLVVMLRNARGGEQFSLVASPSLFPSGKTVDASGPFKLYGETGADESVWSQTWTGTLRFVQEESDWSLTFDISSTALPLVGEIHGNTAIQN